MTPSLPPSDPQIPRYRHQQLDALAAMFGEAEPLPRSPRTDRADFTPLAGTLKQLASGTLSWIPAPLPEWAGPPELNALELYVAINHRELERRACPRLPATQDALKVAITRYGPQIGIHTLALTAPPAAWTTESIRELIMRAVQCIPGAGPDVSPDDIQISYANRCKCGEPRAHGHLHVTIDDIDYSAELAVPQTEVLEDWSLRLCPAAALVGSGGWVRTLAAIDRAFRAKTTDDDDDDLDAIEKAARRRLHGEKSIPDTSRAVPTSQREEAFQGDQTAEEQRAQLSQMFGDTGDKHQDVASRTLKAFREARDRMEEEARDAGLATDGCSSLGHMFAAAHRYADVWQRRVKALEKVLRDALASDCATDDQRAAMLRALHGQASAGRDPKLLTETEAALIANYRASAQPDKAMLRTLLARLAEKGGVL